MKAVHPENFGPFQLEEIHTPITYENDLSQQKVELKWLADLKSSRVKG